MYSLRNTSAKDRFALPNHGANSHRRFTSAKRQTCIVGLTLAVNLLPRLSCCGQPSSHSLVLLRSTCLIGCTAAIALMHSNHPGNGVTQLHRSQSTIPCRRRPLQHLSSPFSFSLPCYLGLRLLYICLHLSPLFFLYSFPDFIVFVWCTPSSITIYRLIFDVPFGILWVLLSYFSVPLAL